MVVILCFAAVIGLMILLHCKERMNMFEQGTHKFLMWLSVIFSIFCTFYTVYTGEFVEFEQLIWPTVSAFVSVIPYAVYIAVLDKKPRRGFTYEQRLVFETGNDLRKAEVETHMMLNRAAFAAGSFSLVLLLERAGALLFLMNATYLAEKFTLLFIIAAVLTLLFGLPGMMLLCFFSRDLYSLLCIFMAAEAGMLPNTLTMWWLCICSWLRVRDVRTVKKSKTVWHCIGFMLPLVNWILLRRAKNWLYKTEGEAHHPDDPDHAPDAVKKMKR